MANDSGIVVVSSDAKVKGTTLILHRRNYKRMAFTFGNNNLFVKGLVQQVFRNGNGDVVGYDNVASEGSLNYTFNLQEITGYLGRLAALLPDTTRCSGSYTSQAFSMETRQLQTGGTLAYNGVSPVCEEVTANSTTLTVTGTPVKDYAQPESDTLGWCYVHEKGATTYQMTNYGINLSNKTVQNFTAVSGRTYIVTYFAAAASNRVLGLPASANPHVLSLSLTYGVYAMQNGSQEQGSLAYKLYVNVPKVKVGGDAGLTGGQTSNSTTTFTWQAIDPQENLYQCDTCSSGNNNYAYYILVPCTADAEAIAGIAVVGGGISVAAGATKQLPVKFVMTDNTVVQPNYGSGFTFTSATTGTATVTNTGVVTGVSAGSTTITATYTSGSNSYTTTANVTVTA